MLLNIIMFIVGAVCGFAFAAWAETEEKEDLKDEYIEEDYPYNEDEDEEI